MPGFPSGLTYADLVGTTGTPVVVSAYFLTQARMLNSDDPLFPLTNFVGSLLIAFSLFHDFNLASALMEFFWISISLMGLWRAAKERRQRLGE